MAQDPLQPAPHAAIRGLKPTDLPAPPQTAITILRASSDDNVDLARLTDIACQDPGLVAEILRLVNSPLYGLGNEISSAQQAIGLLGTQALCNMVLCLAVRETLSQHQLEGLDITAFWEAALRRAVSAKGLYEALGFDANEGFTAGLLQDFGLLVLLQMNTDKRTALPALGSLDPERRLEQEIHAFGLRHDEVLEVLSEAWSLPSALAEPLRHHHDFERHPTGRPWQLKSRALYCADWVNAVFSSDSPASALQRARTALEHYCALDEAGCEAHLSAIPAQVEQAAEALGLRVQKQDDLDEIMRRANTRLAAANMSYQELTWKLEKAIAERDQLAEELNKEIRIAQEIQRKLLPPQMEATFPVFGMNVPASNLSGDFFDYFRLRDNRIYFCLGDVAGKGINAGLLMAKASSLFHCLGKHIHDPAKLVGIINDELAESSTRGYFVTLVAGVFDPARAEVELVNAGHLPAILLDKHGNCEQLEAQGPPIGIAPGVECVSHRQVDLRGRCLFVASDGITERRLDNNEQLGLEGLTRMLIKHGELAPRARVARVMQELAPDNGYGDDDMTLMVVNGRHD